MFTYSNYSDGTREWDLRNIKPVDAKIYYENKQPYLEYTGEAIGPDGMKVTVHIPKIGLTFRQFHCKETTTCNCGYVLGFNMEAYATTVEDVLFTITEREMTKEQINALAGCKVKIVEGKK